MPRVRTIHREIYDLKHSQNAFPLTIQAFDTDEKLNRVTILVDMIISANKGDV